MQILANAGGIATTNSFLLADEQSRQAVIFDAPNDTVAPLLDQAQQHGWDVVGLWFTHGHFDHIADHAVVTARFPQAKVLIHRLDEPKLEHPNQQYFSLPFHIPPRRADQLLEDEMDLLIGSVPVRVLHTPGHSAGHVVYHLPTERLLVGGDLIIMGAIGRTDLPDSEEQQMVRSLQRVMALPDETQLLPGHGRPETLGEQRKSNPYVRMVLRDGRLW